MLQNILLYYLPNCIGLGIFIYSLFKLLKNGNSFYNRQILCAVGVYVLAQIYSDILKIVGSHISTDFSIKYIGLIAAFLFILTAEIGVLDNVIDDKSEGLKKYRRIANFAPILMITIIVAIIIVVLLHSDRSKGLLIILLTLTYLPAIPGIYYIFKHTIMPTNGVPFLKKIKSVEAILFYAYIFSPLRYLFLTLGNTMLANIVNVVVTLLFSLALLLNTKEAK